MTTVPRLALTIPEAAQAAGTSPDRIRKAIHATDPAADPPPLAAYRQGRTFVVRVADLDEWTQRLPRA